MVKHTLLGLAVVGFLSSALALAADAPAKPGSLARDYLVGNWDMEGMADGKAVKGTMQVRPSAGGKCLIYQWSFGSASGPKTRGTAVAGLDPAKARFFEFMFESDGSHYINSYPPPKNQDTGIIQGEREAVLQGKAYTARITVERKNRNEFLYTVASESHDDVTFTFRRVVQAISPNVEHLKDLQDYLGTWVAEEILQQDVAGFGKKGEKAIYQPSLTWILNKAAMQMDYTATAGKTTFNVRWLFGWDNQKNAISYSGVATNGGRDWGTLKKVAPDKWVWEMKWITPDGKEASCTDVTTMLENNTIHRHQYTKGLLDGKPQPDRTLEFKRVK